MNWKRELAKLAAILGLFAALYLAPLDAAWLNNALGEGLRFAQDYARQHACQALLPSLILAGAISAFINKASVMKYLGARASKPLAYGVASVSGTQTTSTVALALCFMK